MRARYIYLVAPLLGLVPTVAAAEAADPATAGGQRQQGLALQEPPPAPSGATPFGWRGESKSSDDSPGRGQRIAGFALIGAGVVGLTIGAIFGLSVSAKNRDIDAICPTGQPCPLPSVIEYNNAVVEAKIDRAASLVGFGVGAIFVGTGVALVLTAPKGDASGRAAWLTPAVGSAGLGATLGGTW